MLYVKKNGVATPAGGGSDFKYVSGTLTAGNTSITLSDASISTADTCLIDWYTNDYNVVPTAIAVASGSVTFTFNSQLSDIKVTIKITNI